MATEDFKMLGEHLTNKALRNLHSRAAAYFEKRDELRKTNLRHEVVNEQLREHVKSIQLAYQVDLKGVLDEARGTIDRVKTAYLRRESADPAKQLLWLQTRRLELEALSDEQKSDLISDYINGKQSLDRHSIRILMQSVKEPLDADRLRTVAEENRYSEPWIKEPAAAKADYTLRAHGNTKFNSYMLDDIENQLGDTASGPVGYYITAMLEGEDADE